MRSPQQTSGAAAPRRSAKGLLVVGLLLQVGVLIVTAGMILIWGPHWTYWAAALQASAGLVAVVLLWRWRPVAGLLVPAASLLLTVALFAGANLLAAATGCSPHERAVFAELAPPPGTTVELKGELPIATAGCVARFSAAPTTDVVAHYREQFAEHGWQEVTPRVGVDVAAVRDGVGVMVEVYERNWVLIEVTEV